MTTYIDVYNRAAPVFENWEAWFDPGAPDEVYPDDLIHPTDQAIADLEVGLTYWHHPGWIQDVVTIFEDWAITGKLIRLRLTAEWLLSTVPEMPLDDEFVYKLYLIAEERFCEAYEGESCPWPKLPKFYMEHLNWKMVQPARESLQQMAPKAMEWLD